MPRLFWFLRVAIALAVGFTHTLLMVHPENVIWRLHIVIWNACFFLLAYVVQNPDQYHDLVVTMTYLPVLVTTLAAYAVLPVIWARLRNDGAGETRCRKCGYILRGIPEPRCSECGERI